MKFQAPSHVCGRRVFLSDKKLSAGKNHSTRACTGKRELSADEEEEAISRGLGGIIANGFSVK